MKSAKISISFDLTWPQVAWSATNLHLASYVLIFHHYIIVSRDNIMVTLYDWSVNRVYISVGWEKGAGTVAQVDYRYFLLHKSLSGCRENVVLGNLRTHLMRLLAAPRIILHL